MFLEIDDETADKITSETLKSTYDNVFETLKQTLSGEEFTASHSFDFDEEVFEIIKELKALELIIENFGGSIRKPVDEYLKEVNKEVYQAEKSFQELKKENEVLVNQVHILEEDLGELKDKIKGLLG